MHDVHLSVNAVCVCVCVCVCADMVRDSHYDLQSFGEKSQVEFLKSFLVAKSSAEGSCREHFYLSVSPSAVIKHFSNPTITVSRTGYAAYCA